MSESAGCEAPKRELESIDGGRHKLEQLNERRYDRDNTRTLSISPSYGTEIRAGEWSRNCSEEVAPVPLPVGLLFLGRLLLARRRCRAFDFLALTSVGALLLLLRGGLGEPVPDGTLLQGFLLLRVDVSVLAVADAVLVHEEAGQAVEESDTGVPLETCWIERLTSA